MLFNIFIDVEGHTKSLVDQYRMGIQECWMAGVLGNGAFQEDLEILEAKAVSVNLGRDEKQGGLLLGDVTFAWSWSDKTGAQAWYPRWKEIAKSREGREESHGNELGAGENVLQLGRLKSSVECIRGKKKEWGHGDDTINTNKNGKCWLLKRFLNPA